MKKFNIKSDSTKQVHREKKTPNKDSNSFYSAWPLWKKILISVLAVLLILFVAITAYVAYIIHGANDIETDKIYDILSESSIIYDDQENKIDSIYATENRTNISYKELPDNLKNAFVALEDKTFWKHKGFNFVRILGAVKDSFTSGRVSGTSTITQQLARNIFLKESKSERSIKRKIIEAYYTVIIEKRMTKEQILEAYLNTIYLGNNSNGVQAAAQAYFSKNANELDLNESVSLAALPQAPTEYSYVKFVGLEDIQSVDSDTILKKTPFGAYILNTSAQNRREVCLKLMLEQKMISKEEYDSAKKVEIKDIVNPNYSLNSNKAAYFNDYVIDEVVADLAKELNISKSQAKEKVYDGGLKIYSTMDKQAQDVIEAEFADDSNFPVPAYMSKNSAGDFIDKAGNVALYNYYNYFNEDGTLPLSGEEAWINDDGSVTLAGNKRLNFYDTKVNGKDDISVELKNMYLKEDGNIYVISGGFINIPQSEKNKSKDGNVTISKNFVKNNPKFFIINDGTVTIGAGAYKLRQQVIQPQAAMTIIDTKTGQIKAMVGGRGTEGRGLFNRATAPRQPGSAIKPIGVYAPAIQQSFEEVSNGKKHNFKDFGVDKQGTKYWGDYITPASVIIDEPTTIEGRQWPKNYDGSFSGPMDLKTALAMSRNTTSVKTYLQVGANYCANMLEKFGITSLVKDGNSNDLNASAIALGGMVKGISPLELTNAYTAFSNGGVRHKTHSYTKVLDRKGNVLLEAKTDEGEKVLDPGVAFVMNKVLQYSVNSGFARPAGISGVGVGAKTGTTSDFIDIWTAGYTPSYAAAIWIGSDVSFELGESSERASILWGKIMRQIDKAKQGTYPQQPGNVIASGGNYFIKGTENGVVSLDKVKDEEEKKDAKVVNICKDSNMLATPWCLHIVETTYLKGAEDQIPKYYCPIHNKDASKYPIAPGEKLREQPDEQDKPDDSEGASPLTP